MTAFEAMHARPGEESPGGETRARAHVKSERTSQHRDNYNGLSHPNLLNCEWQQHLEGPHSHSSLLDVAPCDSARCRRLHTEHTGDRTVDRNSQWLCSHVEIMHVPGAGHVMGLS